jgi:geranylgeranylglycerol-phosphate geranylgeranyltransferase
MMKKLKAIWELMRLEHGVMIAIAILVGSLIAQKGFPAFDKFVLTFFTALFLEASTFALNDYYDLEIDKKNKRTDRPLVRGDLAPKTALYLFILFFPLGIICSYFVNLTCFMIALITALFAVLYDAQLKKIKLVGNFFIAYVMAIPFVFGGAAVIQENILTLNLSPAIFIIAFIAFLAGFGREIMKDVMDFEGDKAKGVKSLPQYIGIRKSNALSAFFYIIAIVLSFIPFFVISYDFYYLNYYYLFFILITDTMLLSTSFQLILKKKVNLNYHRKFTLIALFVGLLAFLIGAFTAR